MAATSPGARVKWQPALDEPGSAGPGTVRRTRIFGAVVVMVALLVLAFGGVPLGNLPEFANFHASLVLVADGITAFLLFGQFHHRRQWSYAILGAGYLFTSLVSIPFLLSFPGALVAGQPLLGGTQSSIWVWHGWHLLFPIFVAFSVAIDRRPPPVAKDRILPIIGLSCAATALLTAAITIAVTLFHDRLPVLITVDRLPLTRTFYVVGGATVVTTAACLALVLAAARRRTVLHAWLAMVLIAYLADELISLGSHARYTLAWYGGRVESMLAISVLLVVFINELDLLYRRLGSAMNELFAANEQLAATVAEKEDLLLKLRETEEHVRRMAYHDPVTGLANRRLAMERLEQAMAQAVRQRHRVAVLFLDVDYFKEINDRYGHETGDALLREIGVRMESCVRISDTVARFGGDEFVVTLPEIREGADAEAVAAKLIECFSRSVDVLGQRIQLTTSIGIASCLGEGCADAGDLVRRADVAMYAAKQAGRNRYQMSREG